MFYGQRYDGLVDVVDRLEVSHPTKLTWIRTAKKNDRIDARKQAVLLSMNELPRVHMPREGVREWRRMIQHRRTLGKGGKGARQPRWKGY